MTHIKKELNCSSKKVMHKADCTRLIKSLELIASQLVQSKNENDFFEDSAELLRICAVLVFNAQFAKEKEEITAIPYARQAIEYAVDHLFDLMIQDRINQYDN